MEQHFNIIIPSNRPVMANKTKDCLKDYEVIMFDGSNYPSFSKMINDCIMLADKETVIIANDKVRPTPFHVKKTLHLLKKGFGFVGLWHFAFFGFTKDLIRTVGFFDERFLGGGQEDRDFGRRLLEKDIAVFISGEVPYEYGLKSSWKGDVAEKFYNQKWKETEDSWERLLPDETYSYDIGEMTGQTSWMPYKDSFMIRSSLPSHLRLKYFNNKPIDLSQLKCSEIF